MYNCSIFLFNTVGNVQNRIYILNSHLFFETSGTILYPELPSVGNFLMWTLFNPMSVHFGEKSSACPF